MVYKSGFVAIIGRPNAGKSTLLNRILEQKIAITSEKAQTTRQRIKGIHTTDKGQIVFIDTPGVHKPKHKLGEYLVDEAKSAIPDADLILYIVDGTEKAGTGEQWIIENLLVNKKNVILLVNKVDRIKSLELRDKNIASYKELFTENIPVVKISAKTGRNLDTLIDNIYKKLPEGPKYYPDEELTDQNLRTISAEIIRESILKNTEEEVPHSTAVIIELFEEKEKITHIMGTIFVEKDSQKGIIIGKQGSMLKKIGSSARLELEEMLEKKVFLELFVKVKKDWRKKDKELKDLGYVQE